MVRDRSRDMFSLASHPALRRFRQKLEGVARNSIRLRAYAAPNDEEIPAGATKLGGCPDLPKGADWPSDGAKSVPFLGQFKLEDLVPYDVEEVLPKTGMLYFFFNDSPDFDGCEGSPGEGRVRVLYYDVSATSELERREFPEDGYIPGYTELRTSGYHPCLIRFNKERLLLFREQGIIEGFGFSDEEVELYDNLQASFNDSGLISQMLGYPDPCSYGWYVAGERLLLQLDDDAFDPMKFRFGRRLYVLMLEEDMKRRDFSNAWEAIG